MGGRILILALTLAAPAAAQTTDAFAGIPGVAFDIYDVRGEDVEAIRRSIDAQRIVDPHDGARADAASWWRYAWSGDARPTADGGCAVRGLTVRFSATVRLPRLVSRPDAATQALWDGYIVATERHEAGHVRYAYEHRGEVADAIRAAGCGDRDAAAKAAIARIDAWELAYERATRHGATQGAVIP